MQIEPILPELLKELDFRCLLERLKGEPPRVIEIIGTPNAGKTMALYKLASLLEHSGGCRVKTIYESAARCPIKKKLDPAYCEWIACETMQQLLESIDCGYELILCERGLMDVLCWKKFYCNKRLLSQECYDADLGHVVNSAVFGALKAVIAFTCEPSVAVGREYPASFSAPPGQVVNIPVLTEYNQALAEILDGRVSLLPHAVMDTTRQTPEETTNALIAAVAGVLAGQLEIT